MIHAHSCCFAHKTIFFTLLSSSSLLSFLKLPNVTSSQKGRVKGFFSLMSLTLDFPTNCEPAGTTGDIYRRSRFSGRGRGPPILFLSFNALGNFFLYPKKILNLKDYCYVLLTHWSILAQNCGLIRIYFPVVIIKLGCWTCYDCKQII